MKLGAAIGLLVSLPGVAFARTAEAPPEVGPKKEGVELEIELGFGACPECAYSEVGLSLGGRASYRWASGLALGAYIMSINANGPGSCGDYGYGYGDSSDCYEDELVLVFFGGEGRFYPLSSTTSSFDPLLALGVGYGLGASRGGGPDLAEYQGLAFLPRFGALALLTDTVSIGGSVGRSFALWTSRCTDGDSISGEGSFSCDDERVDNPSTWFLTLDAEIKL